jgi:hypothetical protein
LTKGSLLGIKIMMPPEVVDSVAGALIAKQVLREIVRNSVKTPLDEHYFAVMMHKGISGDLKRLSFGDLAKLLTCQTTTVHHMIAEHIVNGGVRGGCKFCNGASRELKALIVEEKSKNRSEEPFSLFIAVSAIASSRRRLDNRMGRSLRLPARPRFSA